MEIQSKNILKRVFNGNNLPYQQKLFMKNALKRLDISYFFKII